MMIGMSTTSDPIEELNLAGTGTMTRTTSVMRDRADEACP